MINKQLHLKMVKKIFKVILNDKIILKLIKKLINYMDK